MAGGHFFRYISLDQKQGRAGEARPSGGGEITVVEVAGRSRLLQYGGRAEGGENQRGFGSLVIFFQGRQ